MDFFLGLVLPRNYNFPQISIVKYSCIAGNMKKRDRIGLRKISRGKHRFFRNKDLLGSEYVYRREGLRSQKLAFKKIKMDFQEEVNRR